MKAWGESQAIADRAEELLREALELLSSEGGLVQAPSIMARAAGLSAAAAEMLHRGAARAMER